MFCAQCGTEILQDAQFCWRCGAQIAGSHTGFASASATPPEISSPALGTKWLKFWNYWSLPVGGIVGLLMSVAVPPAAVVLLPIAILQFAVAYGLHARRLWAWKWNWVLVILVYCMVIPDAVSTYDTSRYSAADVWARLFLRLLLAGLIWMWPNYIYWKKRRVLFR